MVFENIAHHFGERWATFFFIIGYCVLLGSQRSCRYWNMMNNDGTTKSKPAVPNSIPPTVPTPTEILPFAPTPCANIKGSIPNTIVMEVIKIGRSLAIHHLIYKGLVLQLVSGALRDDDSLR